MRADGAGNTSPSDASVADRDGGTAPNDPSVAVIRGVDLKTGAPAGIPSARIATAWPIS